MVVPPVQLQQPGGAPELGGMSEPGGASELHVRGILAFLMPSLGSMSMGVYEDNKGVRDLAKKTLSPIVSTSTYGTIFSGRWLSVVTSLCSIFGQKISMRIS